MMGSSNAVNLTDGLDGLAIVPVMIAAGSFALIAYLAGNAIFSGYLGIPHVPGTGELAVFCGAIVGASLGFLWFNAPPAMVFMGDTGSLSTGGALGAVAVAVKHELVLAIIGGLFVLEAVSVIVQVASFKLTGRRVFRMAPAAPPFREDGLAGAHHRHPVLDHRHDPGAGRPLDVEAAMTGLERYAGRRVGILGMARSGIAAARALAAAGADVVAFDDRPEAVADTPFRAGRPADVPGLALLVPSPGVPLTHPRPHPLIQAARDAGVPVRGDVDLFAAVLGPRPIVGITGTNGKSTTTALVHHLLAAAGVDAVMGGNIGRPVFELDPGPVGRIFVLELSSFQLDLCHALRCRVAVWLNLTSDHLDRHGDLAGYVAAKERIFRNQQDGDAIVIGVDDAPSREVAARLVAAGRRPVTVTVMGQPDAAIAVADGRLVEGGAEVADLRPLQNLRGRHNWQNIAVAYGTVRALGLAPDRALAGLASFRGLAHRMEEVARAGHVLWVNDSKATNPDSAEKSLASFANVFWIAGGKPKPGGFRSLRPALGQVRAAYLIGTAAGEIAADLGDLGADAGGAAPWRPRSAPPAPPPAPRTARRPRCFWRRPAPRSTSSRISRRAARRSAPWPGRRPRDDLRPAHGPLDRRQLVVDRRPHHAGRRRDPGAHRHHPDLRRQPGRRRAGVRRRDALRQQAPDVAAAGEPAPGRRLDAGAAGGAAPGDRHVCRLRVPAPAHPVLRTRGEGCHPLAADPGLPAAAERVRQAGGGDRGRPSPRTPPGHRRPAWPRRRRWHRSSRS